jgi:hypothetical protein
MDCTLCFLGGVFPNRVHNIGDYQDFLLTVRLIIKTSTSTVYTVDMLVFSQGHNYAFPIVKDIHHGIHELDGNLDAG